jgi:predicted NUDIX family NTP pyrophosphohydrolase
MAKKSAGLLLFREVGGGLEVLLVHPGGPFWARRDDGAWSIPKGLIEQDEDALTAARREFHEETGLAAEGAPIPLRPLRQPSGKIIYAWAVRCDLDPERIESNTFEVERPPGSGQRQEFPEIDRGAWFGIDEARRKILAGQIGFLDQLEEKLL